MMAVAVSADPGFTAGKPTVLFEGLYEMDRTYSNYDVTDEGRFVMVQSEERRSQINVVLNWFDELKRLVPTN